jgi:nucleotide-binding universal stress UspA family protein
MKNKSVLVAVDGSQNSLEAIRYLSQLRPAGVSSVNLFHVLSPLPETFWDDEQDAGPGNRDDDSEKWVALQKEATGAFLDSARQLFVKTGWTSNCISVSIKVRERGIAADIASEAQRGYRAVVVGRRGTNQMKSQIIGSVANRIANSLHHFPVWILSVRPDLRKILIAMDRSDGALRALDYAGELLGKNHPEILLLHVVRGSGSVQRDRSVASRKTVARQMAEMAGARTEQQTQEMRHLLASYVDRLVRKGLDPDRIRTKILVGVPSRAGALVKEARSSGCGTIVIGRRGLSSDQAYVMGRVSNKVLHLASDISVWLID